MSSRTVDDCQPLSPGVTKTVGVWDANTGREVATLEGHGRAVQVRSLYQNPKPGARTRPPFSST